MNEQEYINLISKYSQSYYEGHPQISDASFDDFLGNCPQCGKPLVVRKGKFGLFIGCSGFPKCHYLTKLNK